MNNRKKIIGWAVTLCCCVAIGICVKINADKSSPKDQVIMMEDQYVYNKIVEEKDGSVTTTTVVTSEPRVTGTLEPDYIESED